SPAFWIVEGLVQDLCKKHLAVGADLDLASIGGLRRRDPGHADRPSQIWTEARAGDPSERFATIDDHAAFGDGGGGVRDESDQLLRLAAGLSKAESGLADEVRLFEFDAPGHVCLERRRERVGVLANDEMLLLQPQGALRFHAEGAEAELR